MKISTKGRYALRVMIDLAVYHTGEYIPLKDIAARQNITVKYLEQIMPSLNRAGYVKSARGNNGGYRLARPADTYTALGILEITEGSLAPVSCLDDDPNDCQLRDICPTLPVWQGLYKVIQDYLRDITLDQLADHSKSLLGNDFSI